MLLLLIFIFTLTIFVGVTAIAAYLTTVNRNQLDSPQTNQQFDEPPNYRSLFEPTDEEIRALEIEKRAEIKRLEKEKVERLIIERNEKVLAFLNDWTLAPDKHKTVELLRLATQCENAKIFFQITESVIKQWRENKIENITASDLANLLDSHFRTLPQQERTSGVGFRLKQEIAELRSKSEDL
jgi:hypothetical protein